jgi:hypothetical protein
MAGGAHHKADDGKAKRIFPAIYPVPHSGHAKAPRAPE